MINFPANPTENQIFNFNGKSYQYISGRWISLVTHMLVNGSLEERLLALEAKIAARIGTIFFVADDAAPEGSLICDGRLLSRTTYADLFAKLGTTYGAGDGSTTFQLPDYRGEFLRGWDGGRGVDADRVRGSFQTDQNKTHTHTGTTSSDSHTHTHTGTTSSDSHTHTWSGTTSSDSHTHTATAAKSGGMVGGSSSGSGGVNTSATITTSSYAHTHTVSGTTSSNAHTHTVSGTTNSNSHSHTFTTAGSGGGEVRVRNKAELICIWVA